MFYIADGNTYLITEVAEADARISNDTLMSNTDQPLAGERYHINNTMVFTYVKWFTSRDAAVQFLGTEAERELDRKQAELETLIEKVERMNFAINKAASSKLAGEIQSNIVNAVAGGDE